jgi:hypothetical protein
MKKSKCISLALITAALASCHKETKNNDWNTNDKKVYLRSDTTAEYSRSHFHNNGLLWYYAFRPYGYYNNGSYSRAGYYSSGISESSNIGHSAAKSGIVRGGFGGHGFSVSS